MVGPCMPGGVWTFPCPWEVVNKLLSVYLCMKLLLHLLHIHISLLSLLLISPTGQGVSECLCRCLNVGHHQHTTEQQNLQGPADPAQTRTKVVDIFVRQSSVRLNYSAKSHFEYSLYSSKLTFKFFLCQIMWLFSSAL